jgi:hypothetical protein
MTKIETEFPFDKNAPHCVHDATDRMRLRLKRLLSHWDGQTPIPRFVNPFATVSPSPSVDCSSAFEDSRRGGDNEGFAFETILAYRPSSDGFDYFIKFKDRPYRCCRWMTRSEFCKYPYRTKILAQYHKNVLFPPQQPYYDPSFDEIDRIIGRRHHSSGRIEYFVKWINLPYDYCTWEASSDVEECHIIAFEARNVEKRRGRFHRPSAETYCALEVAPVLKNSHQLSEDQLEGLNWLFSVGTISRIAS